MLATEVDVLQREKELIQMTKRLTHKLEKCKVDAIEGVSIKDLEKTLHLAHSKRDAARLARKEIKVQLGALKRELKVERTTNRGFCMTLHCFL